MDKRRRKTVCNIQYRIQVSRNAFWYGVGVKTKGKFPRGKLQCSYFDKEFLT